MKTGAGERLTRPEAAEYVGLKRTSFDRTVCAGEIRPAERHIHGGLRFDPVELDRYLERCRRRAMVPFSRGEARASRPRRARDPLVEQSRLMVERDIAEGR